MEFKSLEQLQHTTPSIFTTTSSDNTTDKYVHIPTDRVIRDMELLGWRVVKAQEVRARTNIGYQKHLVVFRNPDVKIVGKNDGDVLYPQILVTNSHDGKNSFIFRAGIFRLICSNGLVIATEEFEKMKIRHMGYDFEELASTIKEMVEKLPLTVETINKMKNIELSQEQSLSLAKDLLSLRVETDIKEDSLIQVLNPQRDEDDSNMLWETFNRIQENIIEGNFTYNTSSGRSRRAREIKSFNTDLNINSEMFSKALEYVN